VKNLQITSLISEIESYVLSLPYTKVSNHQMGGREFWVKGKEIGHIHRNGDLDILFTKAIRNKLLSHNLIEIHKWIPNSGWTTFTVKSESDIQK